MDQKLPMKFQWKKEEVREGDYMGNCWGCVKRSGLNKLRQYWSAVPELCMLFICSRSVASALLLCYSADYCLSVSIKSLTQTGHALVLALSSFILAWWPKFHFRQRKSFYASTTWVKTVHPDNTFWRSKSCVMASTHRAPKQWYLSKVETINSFENWKQNLLYTLSLNSNFTPFLTDGVTWLKKTKAQLLRGLENDGKTVPLSRRLTARQKVNFLELMLHQITNYCPIISRSTLVKNSTFLEFIW